MWYKVVVKGIIFYKVGKKELSQRMTYEEYTKLSGRHSRQGGQQMQKFLR